MMIAEIREIKNPEAIAREKKYKELKDKKELGKRLKCGLDWLQQVYNSKSNS